MGYRAYILRKADRLNLKGWVKNLNDGRVEAVFCGRGREVDKITKLAEKGPVWAQVKDIEIIDEEYQDEFSDFQVLY